MSERDDNIASDKFSDKSDAFSRFAPLICSTARC
jgi:hypothetical protein